MLVTGGQLEFTGPGFSSPESFSRYVTLSEIRSPQVLYSWECRFSEAILGV